ncbi:hypothetical protein [Thalassomonas actiniarum]|uniref:Uncharacterized protein n=1 Tax=Thalassomonas actiniarum TaxID=485447 RepID=A0AAE9YS04_9GAMM|nr:hypothetical protein [Thalassomonas actiniarum]WDD99811.1 hypothetical protein SG35_003825 [Thalassomonas actiniarum]
MLRIILITLLTLITSNVYGKTSNWDVMVPCHGCSDYKKELEALNAAFRVGQTIYVVDNQNGQFYVNEYYVNSVDPDSYGAANANMRLMTKHAPGSPVSQDFAHHDAILTELTNNITQPFTINVSEFPSAFVGINTADFANWFTDYHYEKKKQDFDLLDAEMAAAQTLTIGVNVKVFSMSYTFTSTNYLEYSFPDGTSVQMKFEVMKNVTTGKYYLQFKDPKFLDSKSKAIPTSKNTLTYYISNGGNLAERGDTGSIRAHIEAVYTAPVLWIGWGEDSGGGTPTTVIRDCYVEIKDGKTTIVCNPS